MNNYQANPRKRKFKIFMTIFIVFVILLAGGIVAVRQVYTSNLQAVSNSEEVTVITIESGSSTKEIALILEEKGIVKKSWAFEWYVRNNNKRELLKAGTYALRPSMDVPEIVNVITKGDVATELVTILPGQRLDQIRSSLINDGFTPDAVDKALDPKLYEGHPALVDKPREASLEGYIYPESFQRTADTTPTQIITSSLDELSKQLTPSLRSAINKQGLTIHEGVILASIIEQEVGNMDDKAKVAQVFLKRRSIGMMLGSDPTAFYGAIKDGSSDTNNVFYDSPYNTRIYEGFPPGPISNVSVSSLQAIAKPANTDFLFFVAGDDGTTHFSKTVEEHEALTRKYCTVLCQ